MEIKKLKAALMIILIITIPFYISSVFADTLQVNKYSGSNNINGYFKNYDKWIFEILAKIDNDNLISPNQVKIQDVNAQNCQSSADGFICTYESDYYSIPDGTYPLTIKLLNDAGSQLLTQNIEMAVDRLPPKIDFESIAQKGENISVLFTIKDRAYIENDYTKCSGIEKIEFYDNARLLKTINPAAQCTYSGSESLTGISSNRVIIKAYDRMGYIASEPSPEIEFDFINPVINPATFKIQKNGVNMNNYLSSMPDTVDFSVEITENQGLKPENVHADFSSLGGSTKVSANSCSREDDIYTCIWNNIQVASTTISIPVAVKDNVGNSASAILSKSVSVDNQDPEVLFIGTDKVYNQQSFISLKADVLVKISESGSGIDPSRIMLDLSSLNSAYGNKIADECISSSGIYSCFWYNITTTKPHNSRLTVYLINLMDNAGNQASGPTQAVIAVDQQPPVPGNIKLQAISELGTDQIIKSNDDLAVIAAATDINGLTAYGDFSNIRGIDYKNSEAICEATGSVFTCRWDIPSVFSGFLDTSVTLKFIDTAGNSAEKQLPIAIYGLEEEEAPDYWSHKQIQNMPYALDRQTTSLINQKMYFHIPLVSQQEAYPLTIGLGSCSGENLDFIENTELINNQIGSKNPYIILTLKTTDARIDAVRANCTLRITSLYNNKVSNVEYETVPLTIQFYNMPLGEAADSLQGKIDDLRKEWVDDTFWQIIGGLQAINDIAVVACNVYSTARSVIAILQTITTMMGSIEDLVKPLSPARIAMCLQTEAARAVLNDQAVNFFEKFCAFANCKLGPLPKGQEIKGLEYWGNVLGGGGGLANALSEMEFGGGARWVEKVTAKEAFGYAGFMNVKDSFALSLMTICIPGIIYNLDKIRQINCMYIDCLESIDDTGMPPTACDKSKSYMECKYFWGEVFQVFPITVIADYIFNLIKQALASPFTIAGVVVSYIGCAPLCMPPFSESVHSICIWPKIIADIGDVIANGIGIAQIVENDWNVREDYCEKIGGTSLSNTGSGTEEEEEESGGIFG